MGLVAYFGIKFFVLQADKVCMIRGYGSRKPNQKKKTAKKAVPLQRVSAEIMIEETKEVFDGRVFLSDLNTAGVACFVNSELPKGAVISVVIEQPKHLYLRGEVAWCTPYTLDTKVLSIDRFDYRIGIKFIFETPQEAEEIKNYINEIYDPASKKSPVGSSDPSKPPVPKAG
jgi:hypothetical protein